MKPTREQVWNAVLQNPEFVARMPEGSPEREIMEPFITASVDVLDGQMDDLVTFKGVMFAKHAFLSYCMGNGMLDAIGTATGMPAFLQTMLSDQIAQIMDQLDQVVDNFDGFMARVGMTEEQMMFHPDTGLNEENKAKWRSGTLTIGELLLTQPETILKNN